MKIKWIAVSWLIVLSLVAAACSPVAEASEIMDEPAAASSVEEAAPAPDDMAGDDMEPSEEAEDRMESNENDDSEMDDPAPAESDTEIMRETPDWFKVDLINAATGETFRIDDFHGKVVLVETMAMWCSSCLKQQQQVKALHDLLGERDNFISVGLDVDINEDAAALATYVERNGFDWIYTVVPAEVGREIGNLYGNQFLNPPATPMLIIDAEGEVHLLPFGIKSAEDLQEALEPFLNDSM